MKNVLKFSVLTLGVISMVGCGAKEDYSVKCTMESNDVINNYSTSSIYEIITDGEIVKKVKTTETVISENETFLDLMEEQLSQNYEKMDESYGGYTTNISKNGNKVGSEVETDYEHMPAPAHVKRRTHQYAASPQLSGNQHLYNHEGTSCEHCP